MTNLDAWRLVNRENPSPADFIDIGFYYMISAAVQRRVWQGTRKPLYLNMFAVMTAAPGIGKSWVMDEVKEVLRMLVRDPETAAYVMKKKKRELSSDITRFMPNAREDEDEDDEKDPDYLVNFAADATTYEALVKAMTKGTDYIFLPGGETYSYASLAAIIDEMTSLFTQNSETTKDFLLSMHGCGTYSKDTLKWGRQTIRNPCFTMLAGTTPERIAKTREIDIVDDGFASRTIFVYGIANRYKPPINIPEYTPDQLTARLQVVAHLYKLLKRYGAIEFSPEAFEWLNVDKNILRRNRHYMLDHYFTRRILHIKKLSALTELGENAEAKHISLESTKHAVEMLYRWEANMHRAFEYHGANELAPTAIRIEHACKEPMTPPQLLAMFYNEVNGPQLDLILSDLFTQGRLFKTMDGRYKSAK